MNLKQLLYFLIQASGDHRIGPQHVSLYMALFQQWCITGNNRISVTQAHIAQVAKVGRTTYHKCMRELHEYGYIQYTASFHPSMGSMVVMVELQV